MPCIFLVKVKNRERWDSFGRISAPTFLRDFSMQQVTWTVLSSGDNDSDLCNKWSPESYLSCLMRATSYSEPSLNNFSARRTNSAQKIEKFSDSLGKFRMRRSSEKSILTFEKLPANRSTCKWRQKCYCHRRCINATRRGVNLSRNDGSELMANPRAQASRAHELYGILVQNSRSVEHGKKNKERRKE